MFGGHSFGGAPFGDKSNEQATITPIFEASWHIEYPQPSRARVKAAAFVASIAFAGVFTDPQALTQPESTSPDRWFREMQTPQRYRRALPTYLQQHTAFVQFAPFQEAIHPEAWLQPLSEPVRFRPALRTDKQQFLAFHEYPVTPERDRWMPQLSEPRRDRRRLPITQQQFTAFVQFAPFPESVHVEAWLQPLSQPTIFRRSVRASQQQFAIYQQFTPYWHPPLDEPVRFRPAIPVGQQQYLAWPPRTIPLTTQTIRVTINMSINAVPTSAFEQMLSDTDADFSYSAVIQPWLIRS